VLERYTLGLLGNAISYTACKHMINELDHKVILNYNTSKEYLPGTILNCYGDNDDQILGK
jgi:hypothetical protein